MKDCTGMARVKAGEVRVWLQHSTKCGVWHCTRVGVVVGVGDYKCGLGVQVWMHVCASMGACVQVWVHVFCKYGCMCASMDACVYTV